MGCVVKAIIAAAIRLASSSVAVVVGALIVVSMRNYLAQFGEWVTAIQGVVFVACVLAFRRGIVGELAARAKVAL
jgi:branched-chain amino acid transport system permease protein